MVDLRGGVKAPKPSGNVLLLSVTNVPPQNENIFAPVPNDSYQNIPVENHPKLVAGSDSAREIVFPLWDEISFTEKASAFVKCGAVSGAFSYLATKYIGRTALGAVLSKAAWPLMVLTVAGAIKESNDREIDDKTYWCVMGNVVGAMTGGFAARAPVPVSNPRAGFLRLSVEVEPPAILPAKPLPQIGTSLPAIVPIVFGGASMANIDIHDGEPQIFGVPDQEAFLERQRKLRELMNQILWFRWLIELRPYDYSLQFELQRLEGEVIALSRGVSGELVAVASSGVGGKGDIGPTVGTNEVDMGLKIEKPQDAEATTSVSAVGVASSGDVKGVFEENKNRNLQTLLDAQLRLQVDVSFATHYDFMLRHGLGDAKMILDVGAGNGYFCARVAELHPQIQFVGVENMPDMVRYAVELLRMRGINNVEIREANILDNPLSSYTGKFDGIMVRYTAYHMTEIKNALQIMRQMLKPNGVLWIIDEEFDKMYSEPEVEGFSIYKKGIEKLYDKFGSDYHMGSKLPALLGQTGFRVLASENDPMSNRDIGTENFQRYVLHEATLVHLTDPSTITSEELKIIEAFTREVVPQPYFYGAYGHVMIAAQKP